jgi:flagellar biosynthetic protein FliP
MLKQTRRKIWPCSCAWPRCRPSRTPEEAPLKVVVPAYVISELKTAFQIGFIVFIPFLIIDMVVASVLMSMGMMMLSPVLVSLPFKIMLFVLADGWTLLIASLVRTFQI